MPGLEFPLAVLIVLLTSLGQVLLKAGAKSSQRLIFNPLVLSGYTLFVGVLVISAVLLRTIEFKYFSVIVGVNYVAASLLAVAVLGERMSRRGVAGCVLVSAGSVLFAL